METRKKILLGVGLLAAVVLLGKKAQRVIPLNQGDPRWANKLVGTGSKTYAAIGCVTTAVTMVVNALRGTKWQPDDLMPGGAAGLHASEYAGGAIKSDLVFAKLGCVVTGRVDNGRTSPGVAVLRQIIDTALAAGQLCVLRVDYDLTSAESNHSIVCFEKTPAGYMCADPAGGKIVEMPNSLSLQRTATKVYDVTGVQTVRR